MFGEVHVEIPFDFEVLDDDFHHPIEFLQSRQVIFDVSS